MQRLKMQNYVIETFGLTKVFKPSVFSGQAGVVAVDNADIKVNRGEIFCLTGPNGAGKTTLLKMLCGLIIPTSGTARVCGYDINKDIRKIKGLIGALCFSENSFFSQLTVRQNLSFFSALYNLSLGQAESRIDFLLGLLAIKKLENVLFLKLSTGMKQRVSLARAFLTSPEILFLDEPLKSLDLETKKSVVDYLSGLAKNQGCTVFYITPDLEEAGKVSQRLALMKEAKIKLL